MQKTERQQRYFAFMMVATDPDIASPSSNSSSTRGSAYELTMHRLRQKYWVLYKGTRLKRYISPKTKLLFYIGGTKKLHHFVVASATVKRVEIWGANRGFVDPIDYLTDPPTEVLKLEDIEIASDPKYLKEQLRNLSFCPRNPKYWGVVLQGGCTGLTRSDWKILKPRD